MVLKCQADYERFTNWLASLNFRQFSKQSKKNPSKILKIGKSVALQLKNQIILILVHVVQRKDRK